MCDPYIMLKMICITHSLHYFNKQIKLHFKVFFDIFAFVINMNYLGYEGVKTAL